MMEDMIFRHLAEQVRETEEVLNQKKRFHGDLERETPLDLILRNQVVIMKALDHIDTDIQNIPR